MDDFIKYIIEFLVGGQNIHLVHQVQYADHGTAPVLIIPSGFFDDDIYMTQASMPQLPLEEVNGVPLLFGNAQIIRNDQQIVVFADIIASTFFLITRYEEYVNKGDRDQYGRLSGRKSLPYRADFLMRPIVDEYGKLLRRWLRETGGVC